MMTGLLTEEVFLKLARQWRRLGVGYSAQEVVRPPAPLAAVLDLGVAPEEAVIDSLPALLYDAHMFGLVLACLERFSDLVRPRRIITLYPDSFPVTFSRQENPPTVESLDGCREFVGMRALVTLTTLAAKLKPTNTEWREVELYALNLFPSWLMGDLREGRIRLWCAERDTEIRAILKTCAGEEDQELADLGVRFPVLTPAPGKKLRARDPTISENPVYQGRLKVALERRPAEHRRG